MYLFKTQENKHNRRMEAIRGLVAAKKYFTDLKDYENHDLQLVYNTVDIWHLSKEEDKRLREMADKLFDRQDKLEDIIHNITAALGELGAEHRNDEEGETLTITLEDDDTLDKYREEAKS